jgi:eukaryotic translation initiation factor 2C
MGVSYAPPAYYADRLCERGRSYLRDWFTPNYDSDHYRKYQAKKDEIELRHKKTLRDAVAALPPVPVPAGRRRAPKSQAQIDLERKSGADMEADVEDKIRQQAQEYFEKERMGGPGPWAAALDKTMFWM